MKIISINIEGRKHLDLVEPFLEREKADVICVMETSQEFEHYLQKQGYHTTYAPMLIKLADAYTPYTIYYGFTIRK